MLHIYAAKSLPQGTTGPPPQAAPPSRSPSLAGRWQGASLPLPATSPPPCLCSSPSPSKVRSAATPPRPARPWGVICRCTPHQTPPGQPALLPRCEGAPAGLQRCGAALLPRCAPAAAPEIIFRLLRLQQCPALPACQPAGLPALLTRGACVAGRLAPQPGSMCASHTTPPQPLRRPTCMWGSMAAHP